MAVTLPSAASALPQSSFPEEARLPIRNQADIAAVEAVPLSERALPESSYAALVSAAKRSPDAQALSFFLSADRLDETHAWSYVELVADVTRAANLFAALGVAAERPVAYVLPNLPETHFAILGRRSRRRGARRQPVARTETGRGYPALRPRFGPHHARSGFEPEGVVQSSPSRLPRFRTLKAIAFVDMADYLDGEEGGAAHAIDPRRSQPARS